MSKIVKKMKVEDAQIFDAIEFAAKAHRGQHRKGSKLPYITHPLNVANTLIKYGFDYEIVVAGLLHDVLEDTDINFEDIEKTFSQYIADLVNACSETSESDTWEARKKHTIAHIKDDKEDVLSVECADKLDNIRAIKSDYLDCGETIWLRFNRPKIKQKWYYQALKDSFLSRNVKGKLKTLIDEFAKEVDEVFHDDNGC